jgi:hypothetical protein
MWGFDPHNVLTWVKTNADNISTYIDGDEKDGITALATVSASQIKWPLYFLAADKTLRVEPSQLEPLGSHWPSDSSSGWKTSNIFGDSSSAHDTQSLSPSAFTSHAICMRRIPQITSSSQLNA